MYVRQAAFDSCLQIGDTASRVVRAAKVRSGPVNLNPPVGGLTALPAAVSGQFEEAVMGPARLSGQR
jgi:hypothetical protein